MHLFFLLILSIFIFSSAYDCQDCKDNLAQCEQWRDNAIKQGRAGKYCDPNDCDHICSEEHKKKNGIQTDAEKYADQRFNAEMNYFNSSNSFYLSLSSEEQKVYNYIISFFDKNLHIFQSLCAKENSNTIGYGLNDNFIINMCVAEKLMNLSQTSNKQAFEQLMSNLKIQEKYWKAAEGEIREVGGSIASKLYY